jgi:hypothetical protein
MQSTIHVYEVRPRKDRRTWSVYVIAGYDIPEFNANGDLDLSIFASVHDVKR